jgi:hypothetical protein
MSKDGLTQVAGRGVWVNEAEYAEGLLSAASVTEFVPILAERRARLAARSAAWDEPVVAAIPVEYVPVPAVPAPAAPGPVGAAPLLAIPPRDLTRLRNDVQRVRMRVSDWRADVRSRHEGEAP